MEDGVKFSEDNVYISHIEQYSFCPRQAENNINGLTEKNAKMEEGEEKHIKNDIRNKFRKSIKQNTIKIEEKEVIQKIISDALNLRKPLRLSEVSVRSEKLKIFGKIDEVAIDNGKISLIEYKTTFRREIANDFSTAAVNQIIAYGLAFREYFNLNCAITLLVKRVYLKYEPYFSYEQLKSNNELGSVNNKGKMLTSYWDADLNKIIYEQIYFGDNIDVDDIKEIIKNIRSRNFKHEANPNKCRFCQYNKSCVYSLIGEGSGNI